MRSSLMQPATHRSKCDWTDYSAMRVRYCVTRHLPRRQPTRHTPTRHPLVALARQWQRRLPPHRSPSPRNAAALRGRCANSLLHQRIHFHDVWARHASKTSSPLNAQFTPFSSGLSPPSLQGCLTADPVHSICSLFFTNGRRVGAIPTCS